MKFIMDLLRAEQTKTKDESGKRYSSPAVEQSSRILFCLAGHPSPQMSLTEICRQVRVSQSKAFGILEALQKTRLIIRGKDGKGYALGPGLITLSRKVLDDLIPSRVIEPVLEALTKETGSTSVYGSISGKNIYIMAVKEAEGTVSVVVRVGRTLPLTYGAHGKAIVALLPQKEQHRILKNADLYFHIHPGKLNRDRLQKELAQCLREGFAYDFSETAQGVNVVTAPVLGPSGVPIGFIEIFVLASAKTARRFGPTVAQAAKVLSLKLGTPEKQ
jgi:DNA-binding IclR family transcriptional regulator